MRTGVRFTRRRASDEDGQSRLVERQKEKEKAKSEVVAPSIDSRLGPIVARSAEGGTRVKAACGVDEHAPA